MALVLGHCVAGANVREVCQAGDQFIIEETSKVFKKEKEMKRGVAFPTSLSINNCICHFSPTPRDPDVLLKEGDLVKV